MASCQDYWRFWMLPMTDKKHVTFINTANPQLEELPTIWVNLYQADPLH